MDPQTNTNTDSTDGMSDAQKPQEHAVHVQHATTEVNFDKDIQGTGIAQLDHVLKGGIPRGATILLAGPAGSGKTTLANMWLFAGYEQFQEPGLFISMTEPVTKAINNVRHTTFFNEQYINTKGVQYTDLRSVIDRIGGGTGMIPQDKIQEVLDEIGNMVIESGAKRVVLDSITAVGYRLQDKGLIRDFIFQLGTLLTYLEATVILTSEVNDGGYGVFGVEEFISDGIINMSYHDENVGMVRTFQVRKMRDKKYDSRPISFRLSEHGVTLFPHLGQGLTYDVSTNRVSTGIAGMDQMTAGGYFEGSCIFLSGAAGTGKTIAGLHFIMAGLARNERCVYVSLEESAPQLRRNAAGFGWDLARYEQAGLLRVFAQGPEEFFLDELLNRIRSYVHQTGAKRFVLDSLSSLINVYDEELVRTFATRLLTYLKAQGVTTIFTHATTDLFGAGSISKAGISTIADQIIMLRYVEIDSQIRHAALVLKMRGSHHEKELREVIFQQDGIHITTDFSGYEGILSGQSRKVSSSAEEQLHSLFVEILGPMGENIFTEQCNRGLSRESVDTLIEELTQQGILAEDRHDDFASRAHNILGTS